MRIFFYFFFITSQHMGKKGKDDLETAGCLALCVLMEMQVQDSAVS